MMGTYVDLRIYDEGKEEVLDLAVERIEELENKLSMNDSNSEIFEINEKAGQSAVQVSEDVFPLIKKSAEYSETNKDGFDYTIGPIVNLWRIGYDDARKPSQEEIDKALPLVNEQNVELDADEQTVFLKKNDMRLDLGAIAKGYITDEAIKVFEENDVTTGSVDLGGNIVIRGNSPSRDEGGWNVGVQNPFTERGGIVGFLNLKDQSIVTSGIYERYLEEDGKQYHHLLSPETGYPFDNEIAGVTIISDYSTDGDALSTAVFALGLEGGLNYVNKEKGIEAIFVTKDKDIYTSDGVTDNFNLSDDEFNWINE
ncbi:MAG: FAD:protein FMN transferase [Atopostipes sp.]|nr:FAD:protein FMN transferase [Atopostipes sp.]